jgi:hypothetical protein
LLPEKVQNSQSCILNIKNTDERCFEYSILASKGIVTSVNGKTNPNPYKKHFDKIKIPENQTYPIDIIEDIPKYEELNKLRIMVYVIVRDEIFDIEYKSENKYEETINLYLIEDNETDNKHFAWIKNISRMRNHLSTDNTHKKFDCDNCYAKSYKTQEKLDEHMKLCMKHKRCLVEYLDGLTPKHVNAPHPSPAANTQTPK